MTALHTNRLEELGTIADGDVVARAAGAEQDLWRW
jgi:hypothetical protein